MKYLKFVWRFAIVLVFIVLFLASAWRLSRFEERVRIAAVEYLKTNIHNSIEIERINITLGHIELFNVEVNVSDEISLLIPKTILYIDIWNALKTAFHGNTFFDVEIFQPKLVYIAPPESNEQFAINYSAFPLRDLSKYFPINKLQITDGSFFREEYDTPYAQNLNGLLNLMDKHRYDLEVYGKINSLNDASLTITGELDLTEGDFQIDGYIEVDDIFGLKLIKEDWLELQEGRVFLNFGVKATQDLRISGEINVVDIEANLGDYLQITDGHLTGELFGFNFEVQGELAINGVSIPVRGTLSDIVKMNWFLEVSAPFIELSDFKSLNDSDFEMQGKLDLHAKIGGDSGSAFGELVAMLNNGRLYNQNIDNLLLNLSLMDTLINIAFLEFEAFGTDVSIYGDWNLMNGDQDYEIKLQKQVHQEEIGLKLKHESLESHLDGVVKIRDGNIYSTGQGYTISEMDSINMLFVLIDKNLAFQVDGREEDFNALLNIDFTTGVPLLRGSLDNINHLYDLLIESPKLPKTLENKLLKLEFDGDFQNSKLTSSIRSLNGDTILTTIADVKYLDKLYLNGNATLFLDNQFYVSGVVHLETDFKKVVLTEIMIDDELSNRIASATFDYSIDENRFSSFDVVFNSFPYVPILNTFNNNVFNSIEGKLDGRAFYIDKEGIASITSGIIFQDGEEWGLTLEGRFLDNLFFFDKFEVLSAIDEDNLVFTAGRFDASSLEISVPELTLNQLDINRSLRLFAPQLVERIGGQINGRVQIAGNIMYPNVLINALVMNGKINQRDGYWLNLQIDTKDKLVMIENMTFGRGVNLILDASGSYNQDNDLFNLNLNSSKVSADEIVGMVLNNDAYKYFLGKSDLKLNLYGSPDDYEIEGVLEVEKGKIGNIDYESLFADFTGSVNEDEQYISIDTSYINWIDNQAVVKGIVPLKNDGEIDLNIRLDGRLFGLLHRAVGFFRHPQGLGSINLDLRGSLSEPFIKKGSLKIDNGSIQFSKVFDRFSNVNIDLEIDSTRTLRINHFNAQIDKQRFSFSNRFPEPNEAVEPLIIYDYNVGVLQFRTANDGVWMVIPGIMKDDWGGFVAFAGQDRQEFEFQGPTSNPKGVGVIKLWKSTFTFPFLRGNGKPSAFGKWAINLLKRMEWDVKVIPEYGNRYENVISGFGDLTGVLDRVDPKIYLDLLVEANNEGLHFSGSVEDTLFIAGELSSNRGTIEYLDMSYSIVEAGVQFTHSDSEPIIYGTAKTTIVTKLAGTNQLIPREIRLKVQANPYGNIGTESVLLREERGRFEDLRIVFEDNEGNSQERILEMMGYSPQDVGGKISVLGGTIIESAVPIRQWTRGFERRISRLLKVDQIEIQPGVAKNIIERSIGFGNSDSLLIEENDFDFFKGTSEYYYYRSSASGLDNVSIYNLAFNRSRVTIGKEIYPSVYMMYTGWVFDKGAINEFPLGMVHTWDLKVHLRQIAPNLFASYSFYFDAIANENDHNVRLNYSFFLDRNRYSKD